MAIMSRDLIYILFCFILDSMGSYTAHSAFLVAKGIGHAVFIQKLSKMKFLVESFFISSFVIC